MAQRRLGINFEVGGLPLVQQVQRDRDFLFKVRSQIEEARNELWLDYMTSPEKTVITSRLKEMEKSGKELMKTFEVIAGRRT